MTRRERMERRRDRRLDWAAGRDRKAESALGRAKTLADGIPLGQPILVGHHSEKRARKDAERIHNGMAKGFESMKMAEHHRARADGIGHQLATSIFTDDADAPERLRERIAGLEQERDRAKAINKAIKKGPGLFEARLATVGFDLTEKEYKNLLTIARVTPYHCDKKSSYPVFPSYHLTNLGANIRRLKERLKTVDALAAQRTRVAEALSKETYEKVVVEPGDFLPVRHATEEEWAWT